MKKKHALLTITLWAFVTSAPARAQTDNWTLILSNPDQVGAPGPLLVYSRVVTNGTDRKRIGAIEDDLTLKIGIALNLNIPSSCDMVVGRAIDLRRCDCAGKA